MNSYVKLGIASLLPVILSIILYLIDIRLEKKTIKRSYALEQLIAGVLFGCLAIVGTEWGIPLDGAMVNCRDAAPLCAGLFFGMPAGIIAGVIGGVERWIAVAWGVGSYTRLACSVSTIVAGVYAGLLRKFMFDNRKPTWALSFLIGLVMEVFHLTMVFVTNFDTAEKAAGVVKICTGPMLVANSCSVMLAGIALTLIAKESLFHRKDELHISDIIQKWLLLTVIFAFLVTTLFMYLLQTNLSANSTKALLANGCEDVANDMLGESEENLLATAHKIDEAWMDKVGTIKELADIYGVAEINRVSRQGLIIESTNAGYIGFDFSTGEQSAAFLVLVDSEQDVKEYVQAYGPIARDDSVYRKYCGIKTTYGFLQVGYDGEQFIDDMSITAKTTSKNRRVGEGGFFFVMDSRNDMIGYPSNRFTKHETINCQLYRDAAHSEYNTVLTSDVYGTEYYYYVFPTEGFKIVGAYPVAEAYETVELSLYSNTFLEVLVFAIIFGMIYFLIKFIIVDKMRRINDTLGEITKGNLNVAVDVRSSEEFASLSDDINGTVETLKAYISEAAARIDKELEFAKSIQYSALPNVFPAFPRRKEFDIHARMDTAKEVGGDFYDFYLTGNDTLNFLIADVSGKGIPAALFMMRAKTELKSLTESGLDINDVFTRGNAALCEGNDANMFVTGWQGKINLKTGLVEYANGGHNQPVVKHVDGTCEYLKTRPGFVLAGMDGVKFKKQELQLVPGDTIYLYTDGITEATDANDELYGDDRLLEYLSANNFDNMKDLCDGVFDDVWKFVKDAPQFDDMTMVALRYFGDTRKPKIHFDEAKIEDIPAVTEFVEGELEKLDCPMKIVVSMNIAIDELYSNIAKYSYAKKPGPTTVIVEALDDPHGVQITFIDEGEPYNPLKKEDPDITLSLEERGIGGLGIFMVKKSMDNMFYEYKDDQNILTIQKYF